MINPRIWLPTIAGIALCATGCELPDPLTGRPCADDRDCQGGDRTHHCATDVPAAMPQVCVPGERALPPRQNRPPIIGTNVTVVPAGETVTASLSITDPDHDVLTVTLESPGAGLAGLLVFDGHDFSYTADDGTSGLVTDRFRMIVDDGTHQLEFNLLIVVVGQTDAETFSTWTGLVSADPAVAANWDPNDHVPDAAIDILVPAAANPIMGNQPLEVGRALTTAGASLTVPQVTIHGDAAFATGRINADVVLPADGPLVSLAGDMRELDVQRDAKVISPVHLSVGGRHTGGALGIVQGTTLEVDGNFTQGAGAGDIEFWPDESERLFAPPTLIVTGRMTLTANIHGVAGRVMVGRGLDAPALQPGSDIEFCFVAHDDETDIHVPRAAGAFLRHTIVEDGARVRALSNTEILGDVELHGELLAVPGAEVRVRGTLFVYRSPNAAVATGPVIADFCVTVPGQLLPAHVQCLGQSTVTDGPDAGADDAPDAGMEGADASADVPDAGVATLDAAVVVPDASGSDPDAGDEDDAGFVDLDAAVGIDASVIDPAGGPDAGSSDDAGTGAPCEEGGPSPFLSSVVVAGRGSGTVDGQLPLEDGYVVVAGAYNIAGLLGAQLQIDELGGYSVPRADVEGRAPTAVEVVGPDGTSQWNCVHVFYPPELTFTTTGQSTSWHNTSAWEQFGTPDIGDDAVVSAPLSVSFFTSVNRVWVDPDGALSGGFGAGLDVGEMVVSAVPVTTAIKAKLNTIQMAGDFGWLFLKAETILVGNTRVRESINLDPDLLGDASLDLATHRLTIDASSDCSAQVSGILHLGFSGPGGWLDVNGDFSAGQVASSGGGLMTVEGDLTATFNSAPELIVLDGTMPSVTASEAQRVAVTNAQTLVAKSGGLRFVSPSSGDTLVLDTHVWEGATATFDHVIIAPGFSNHMDDGSICWTQTCVVAEGATGSCSGLCDN